MNYEELVNRAITGDSQAITELYNASYQKAYAIAVQTLKDETEAFDVVQDAYITAFDSLNSLTDKNKFNSWFGTIVSRKCIDNLRKRKPMFLSDITYGSDDDSEEVEFEDDNKTFSPESNVDISETKRIIGNMLNNLPDDQRLVLLMFYLQDLSIKEISESLQISENTVKSRMNYGKKKIKTQVLDLEKKGVKLYGLAGVGLFAFIHWLLQNNAQNIHVPEVSSVIKNKPLSVNPNSNSDWQKSQSKSSSNNSQSQQSQQAQQAQQAQQSQQAQQAQQAQQFQQAQQSQQTQQAQQFQQAQQPKGNYNNGSYQPNNGIPNNANTVGNVAVNAVKKTAKHKGIKVVSGLLATAIAGTGAAAAISPSFRDAIDVFGFFSSPESVIEKLEQSLNKGDVDGVIKCYTPEKQQQYQAIFSLTKGVAGLFGAQDLVTSGVINEAFKYFKGSDIDLIIKQTKYKDSGCTADLNVEIVDVDTAKTRDTTMVLVKEGNKWYIDKG